MWLDVCNDNAGEKHSNGQAKKRALEFPPVVPVQPLSVNTSLLERVMGYLTEGLPKELQEFPIDVFFSYSHAVFPGESNTELKRWSQTLAKDLREELSLSGLANLSLYLDTSARTDESVDPTE